MLHQDDEQELLTIGADHDVAPAANEPIVEPVGEEIKGPRLSRTLSLWDGTIPFYAIRSISFASLDRRATKDSSIAETDRFGLT